ncbi:amino acid synthesis family protein [Actinopolymorpha sp. B17G11]|uniref:amino acid synthesis family protein n=1 Tax=Actinopolymorpha sp. B17G11 TaxID=3160861 RepID=UPI0032E3DE8D
MSLEVRKIVSQIVDVRREYGRPLQKARRIAIVGVVIANPFPAGYVEDVVSTADAVGAELGGLVGPACVDLLGGDGSIVEAYGKAALVGMEGELEHGSALIHNLRFGNVFRTAAQGTELLPAAEKVGLPGAPIDVPLKHKLDAKTRSHHQTVTFRIEDAPLPREILVLCAAANGGRPLARLAAFGAEVKQ